MLSRVQQNFFYVLLAAVSLLAITMFLPYLSPLLLAGVMAIIFTPFYQKINKTLWQREGVSAFVTVLIVFVAIMVPLGVLAFFITAEIRDMYSYLTDGGGSLIVIDYLGNAQAFIERYLPAGIVPQTTLTDIENYLASLYGWFATHFQGIFNNVIVLLGNIFIFILAFYFFLRDGKKFRDLLLRLSPLQDVHDGHILKKISHSVNSIVKGTLLVAVAQGVCAMIGFWIVGLPSPILWGTITIFASLVPSLGTVLVILPAAIFIFFTKGFAWALGLLLWGTIVVGLIDNLLRPIILERGINIHPFLILLSVFGGITFFGVSGLVLGPIALSVLYAVTEVYAEVTARKKESSY